MVTAWDETVDVLVIGSGFAGLAAAIEARNAGASVMILEKMSGVGGNSMISDGGIAVAGSRCQQKFGIEDTPEMMYDDMMKAGLGLNHPELVKTVTQRSSEVLDWTIDVLGVEYLDRVDIFGGHTIPRCLTPVGVSGATIIRQQVKKLNNLGVSVRTNAFFTSFIHDSDGIITGVTIRDGYVYNKPEAGSNMKIGVRKGIVLATGGFGSDVPFRVAQDPRLDETIGTTNKPFATAEGLKESIRAGAMPIQLSHIQLGPWGTPDEKGYGDGARFSDYTVFPYGILVDPATGKRIVNELADRKTVSDAILATGHICIGIADSRAVETTGWDIEPCLIKRIVKSFETLDELSGEFGIHPAALQLTVDTYNKSVAQKADSDFGKQIMPDASPLIRPPFYAIRTWPKVHHTMGGVWIDKDARVRDMNGKPIPRLYAAGEVAGGVHGACRLGSCAVTDCLVFGRIAGQNAATLVNNPE